MQSALKAFDDSLARARHLHGLHLTLSKTLTGAVDLSDILRAEIVMSVSALDHYVHEIARLGVIECWKGTRPSTKAFNSFTLTMSTVHSLKSPATALAALDSEIRAKHGYVSFQTPDKIADAVRLFSQATLWEEVGLQLGKSAKDMKAILGLIIDRRNKIAHEADVDPSFPGQRWPISEAMVEEIVNNVDAIGHAIHISCL